MQNMATAKSGARSVVRQLERLHPDQIHCDASDGYRIVSVAGMATSLDCKTAPTIRENR